MKGTAQKTEFNPPKQRTVSVRQQKSTEAVDETTELHPTEHSHAPDTNVSFGLLEKSREPQSECALLHHTESPKKDTGGACGQETDTGLAVILPDVKQAMETVELSSDVQSKSQDESALEYSSTQQSIGEGLQEEFETRTSRPEPHTLQNPPCSILDETGDDMLCGDAEKNKVDEQILNTKGVHTEDVAGVTVESLNEKTCSDGETHTQGTDEAASGEPPVKRGLRRRMGMCGLGVRKRRFLHEGQSCKKAYAGGESEEGAGAVDRENGDELKNDTVEEINVSALMDDEATAEELLKQDRSFLEDMSEGEGQTPSTGQDLEEVQNHPSVSAISNGSEIETSAGDNEPNIPSTGTNSDCLDTDLSKKHKALSDEEKFKSDNEVTKYSDEVLKEIAEGPSEDAKEVIYVSHGVIKEALECSVKVTQKDQEILIGLEDSKMEMEEQCLPVDVTHDISPSLNQATTDKPDPNGPQISMSAENEMELEFMEDTATVALASTKVAEVFPETSNTGGQCEHVESPTTAVAENTVLAGGERSDPGELGGPSAPPAGQEKHMHCLLGQDTLDPSLSSAVAKQLVHDLTMTSSELPLELDSSVPLSLCSVTDSQLNIFALNMELEDQRIPEGSGYQEDATELVCGLIRELSSLNRTVMAAHREMELLRRGNKPSKPPSRQCYGPRHLEM